MATSSAQFSVGTTRVLLTAADADFVPGSSIWIRNAGSTDVFIGGPDVTTANGAVLAPASTGANASAQLFPLGPGEQIWAIATVSATVHVLRMGV